jgi:hypothetical protein
MLGTSRRTSIEKSGEYWFWVGYGRYEARWGELLVRCFV